MNVTKTEKRILVLRLLCEGCSIRSVARVTGVEKKTVGRIIRAFGEACQAFLDDRLRDLSLAHIEVDEIWTFVGKKQARLTNEQKASCGDIGDVYLWTCLDASTKLLVTYALGRRSADMARRLIVDLASRLTWPSPSESDPRWGIPAAYRTVTQVSTDGFAGYPEAVDLAFGPYAKYGVLVKNYRNASLPTSYAPAEIVGTDRKVVKGPLDPYSICTSHVERNNGTIRHFMKRFARLTCAFSKKFECLAAACAMFAAYYNFVWRTRYPDDSGRSGRLRPTAAMMAGVTDHLWSFEEFFRTVIQYG